MLFGRAGVKSEDIALDAVRQLVESLFDKKMEGLYQKAARAIAQINDSKKYFIDACDRFDRSSADLDLEGMSYFASASHIRSQKPVYVSTLKRMLDEDSADMDRRSGYYFYERKLTEAQEMINRILKTNGSFKNVVYAYANELGNVKQGYGQMESSVNSLKSVMESGSSDLNVYKAILSSVEELRLLVEEQAMLSAEKTQQLSSRDASARKEIGIEERHRITDAIASRKAEIDALKSRVLGARIGITNLLNSIVKAARRYDYSSLSKTKISDYIEDSERLLIGNAEGYADFYSQVAAMQGDIESGRIQLKDRDEALGHIRQVTSGKLAELMSSIDSTSAALDQVRGALRGIEMEEKEMDVIDGSAASRERKLAEIGMRMDTVRMTIGPKKALVEQSINSAYRKRINILLPS